MGTFFGNIVGNDALKERLSNDIDDGYLSHAYIIEGPRGSGRHTVALSAVAAIACIEKSSGNSPCGNCKNCKKIMSWASPDVSLIGLPEDRATIGVDTVRDIKNDIYTAPNDLNVKAYIIEDAELMTDQAQNAFLLSLEEPPPYVLFFLICENSTSLLETVRSRAPSLRTERLPDTEIEDYILSHDKRAVQLKTESLEQFSSIIKAADGSIGIALSLLNEKTRKVILERKTLAYNIISFLSRSDKPAILEAIASFGTKRAEVIENLISLQYAVRDLILLKKSENAPLCFFEDRENAYELSTHFTSSALLALYDSSLEAARDIDANANIRLSLVCMMQRANLLQ
jgi:DNA polymerase III gamma/tau subunit